MTTFGTYVSTADAEIFSVFGQTATYNDPDGGDATSVSVVLGDTSAETETDDLGRRVYFTAEAVVSLDDIATPADAIGGTLIIGSNTWTLSKVIDQDEGSATYELWRDADQRRHAEQQYRRTV